MRNYMLTVINLLVLNAVLHCVFNFKIWFLLSLQNVILKVSTKAREGMNDFLIYLSEIGGAVGVLNNSVHALNLFVPLWIIKCCKGKVQYQIY